jgi:MFS family permease
MSLLVFTGIGAYFSERVKDRSRRAIPVLMVAITALTLFYLVGLTPVTDALLAWPLAARIPVALAVLAPLGLCLGMFMPLGLGAVAGLSEHSREYVAWGWAVNGFASVIGAVLSTILAMALGFGAVLVLALLLYLAALAMLAVLLRARVTPSADATEPGRVLAPAAS